MTMAAPTLERRRRLKPEARRELILEAAAAQFARLGHRDARMEDIAAAAGITKAVLYDHFPSKGALHAAVVRRASDHLTGTVLAAIAGLEDDLRERFRVALLTTFQVVAERPDVRATMLGDPGGGESVAAASVKAPRIARAAMTAAYLSEPRFLAGHPHRRQRAQHIAQAIIGMINGLAALGVEQSVSPERLTDIAMDLVGPGMEAMSLSAER